MGRGFHDLVHYLVCFSAGKVATVDLSHYKLLIILLDSPFQKGPNVNDRIQKDSFSVQYTSVDDDIHGIVAYAR